MNLNNSRLIPKISKVLAIICLFYLLIITLNLRANLPQDMRYFFIHNLLHHPQNMSSHRDQIAIITYGGSWKALNFSNESLNNNPFDLEALYIKSLAHSQMGQIDQAIAALKNAIKLGLPFERILAGPRNLFAPLYKSTEFKSFSEEQQIELIHGPVLGKITPCSAHIWVRTVHEVPVSIRYSTALRMAGAHISKEFMTHKTDDYTVVIQINNLLPETEYFYDVIINDKKIASLNPQRFRTHPEIGNPAQFQIGFGGGAAYTPGHERIWNTIQARDLEAFLFLGDNVYIDHPDVPETQQYCYYRRQSQSHYRKFASQTPIYAIWDDHDFGENDCTSSLDINNPPWKLSVLDIFKQNFVNPAYGGGAKNPGVWFKFSIADVDFTLLDCRFYRTNPELEDNPTMLGPFQKKWLFDQLRKSNATFKIIASSVPWAEGSNQITKDAWDGFPKEREEIFSFIEDNKINGVVLISADRHRSDVWKIMRTKGNTFYELTSSHLTNIHTHDLRSGALFGYNEENAFGMLSFDTTKEDPELKYQIINIDNDSISSLIIKKSELTLK